MAQYVAASAAGAAGLFEYNRQNFLFDRKIRQECEHQIMDFRIQQAQLWREDVRDIIRLTAVKMDTYLILNTVQLGFCVMALCEGRLSNGTPKWLVSCHTLSLMGAFMYLLMSVWLAMTASVTAQSYEVRLLTQLVRLPMPTWSQLESARTYASTFEKVDARQMFRVPFVQGTQERVLELGLDGVGVEAERDSIEAALTAASLNGSRPGSQTKTGQSADLWGLEARGDHIYELDGMIRVDPCRLRHLHLVREAMLYWQSYDGFARVSMSMGTNQLVTAMSYYVIAYVMVENHAMFAAFFVVGLFMSIAAALIRLDMSLTSAEYQLVVLLVLIGPCLTCICASRWLEIELQVQDTVVKRSLSFLMPFAFFAHALWLVLLLYVCKVSEQKNGAWLPTGFRSVMYIDVFGWIKKTKKQQQSQRAEVERLYTAANPDGISARRNQSNPAISAQEPPKPGFGPGVSVVTYDSHRLPVSTRPENLTGVGPHAETVEVSEEDFIPTTFIPRGKNCSEVDNVNLGQRFLRQGLVPWQIFVFATAMLATLWTALGVEHLGQILAVRMKGEMEPRLVDTTDSRRLDVGGAALVQLDTLEHGEHLEVRWPHLGIRPQGLACYSGESVEAPLFVASTRFGLFASRVAVSADDSKSLANHRAHLSLPNKAIFDVVKSCEAIEGETLQDVALHCTSGQKCVALVLHRQGQYLTSCPLSADVEQSDGEQLSGSIAPSWLEVGADKEEQEELVSFALSPVGTQCKSGSVCAFAQTNLGRVVELRQGQDASTSNGSDVRVWYPSRVLQSHGLALSTPSSSGNIAVVSSAGQYLTVLKPRKGIVEVLDLKQTYSNLAEGEASSSEKSQSQEDRHSVWHLPTDRRWSAACSTGDNFYLLTDGLWPQIWRFQLPFQNNRLSPGVTLASNQSTFFLSRSSLSGAAVSSVAAASTTDALLKKANENPPSRGVGANNSASPVESNNSSKKIMFPTHNSESFLDKNTFLSSLRAAPKAARHRNLRASS